MTTETEAAGGKPAIILYSLQEAAGILGICYTTIYNMARDGRLTTVRVGNRYRILKEDLDAFLRSTRQPAWR